jgi:hypothetical protein
MRIQTMLSSSDEFVMLRRTSQLRDNVDAPADNLVKNNFWRHDLTAGRYQIYSNMVAPSGREVLSGLFIPKFPT